VADGDLFATRADRLAAAYRLRNGLAAFAAVPSAAT